MVIGVNTFLKPIVPNLLKITFYDMLDSLPGAKRRQPDLLFISVMMAKEKPPITVVGDVGGRIAIIVVILRSTTSSATACLDLQHQNLVELNNEGQVVFYPDTDFSSSCRMIS